MFKTIIAATMIFSAQAFASECMPRTIETFQKAHPKLQVREVKRVGVLKPGEDRPYLQGEIWNNGRTPLDIYEIKSSFMARFVHVALVNKQNCQTHKLIEVLFE